MNIDEEKEEEYKCRHICCDWSQIETRRCSLTPRSGEALQRALILESNIDIFWSEPNLNVIPRDASYTDIVELIWDIDTANTFISWLIIHAREHDDEEELRYMERTGFGENTKGRALFKGFLSILNVIGMNKKNISDVHNLQAFIGDNELTEIMPRRKFEFFQRHYRFSNCTTLPARNDPNYHVYQNINAGLELLRRQSIRLFYLGRFIIWDEGRVTQTSKRAAGTNRNVTKPIKQGQDVNYLCGIMEETQGVVYNHVISCGQCSVTNPNEKVTVNHLRQVTLDDPEIDGSGRYLFGDNKFADVPFSEELCDHNVGSIFALSLSKTKHLSTQHQKMKKYITQHWDRGDNELWENDNYVNVELSLWNDSNSASFMATGVKSWVGTVMRRVGSESKTYPCPIAAVLYNSAYHAVDVNNQYQAKCPLDHKTRRKQMRVGMQVKNAYIFENAFHCFKNMGHSTSSLPRITYKGCKAELCMKWKNECIEQNGRNEPYLRRQLSDEQKLLYTYESDREHQAIHINSKNKSKKLRCVICGTRSRWKCSACVNTLRKDNIVVLCGPNNPNRNCWSQWNKHESESDHDESESDVDESESDDEL